MNNAHKQLLRQHSQSGGLDLETVLDNSRLDLSRSDSPVTQKTIAFA